LTLKKTTSGIFAMLFARTQKSLYWNLEVIHVETNKNLLQEKRRQRGVVTRAGRSVNSFEYLIKIKTIHVLCCTKISKKLITKIGPILALKWAVFSLKMVKFSGGKFNSISGSQFPKMSQK